MDNLNRTEVQIRMIKSMLLKANDYVNSPYQNMTFTKFGDGELICMQGTFKKGSTNCDGQTYSKELSESLINSLATFDNLKDRKNIEIYLGLWEWNLADILNTYIKLYQWKFDFTCYETFLHTHESLLDYTFDFYNSIKNTKRKKIYVAPNRLKPAIDWLNIDKHIIVSESNAFDNYLDVKENLLDEITDNCIILYSSGLMSKVLISDVLKENTCTSNFDIGSGLDNVFLFNNRENQIDTNVLKQKYKL